MSIYSINNANFRSFLKLVKPCHNATSKHIDISHPTLYLHVLSSYYFNINSQEKFLNIQGNFHIIVTNIYKLKNHKVVSLTITGFECQDLFSKYIEHCINKGFWQNRQKPFVEKYSTKTLT